MALFPRSFTQEISPLFRMMDDYANISRDLQNLPAGAAWKGLRSFNPKFDVSETKEAYQLHGELPGIDQKDVNIEWTDGNTLTISGRTESHSESGSPEQGKITGEASSESHQPTVEDEAVASAEQPSTTEVAQADSQELAKDQRKFWVTERSVGEFHRSFSFPARVDQDAVKASLKNGILEITVPKAAKPTARKVEIS